MRLLTVAARRRVTLLALLLLMVLPACPPPAGAQDDPAVAILDAMTPAQRVGQLFIVSFVGSDVGAGSDIAGLIRDDQVGAVVLLAANQNFVNEENAPFQLREMALSLQAQALATGPLPMLISIDHEGDGWPYSRLTGGTTPLPSPMAIGATWDPDLAQQVGQLTGQELSAAGINLILGPTVDVLNSLHSTSKGDLGTRVFGGIRIGWRGWAAPISQASTRGRQGERQPLPSIFQATAAPTACPMMRWRQSIKACRNCAASSSLPSSPSPATTSPTTPL